MGPALLCRRATITPRIYQPQTGPQTLNVVEIVIEVGATYDGTLIEEVNWPHDSVVASVRRHGELLIPHGDTQLQAGNALVVVADGEAREPVHSLCRRVVPCA